MQKAPMADRSEEKEGAEKDRSLKTAATGRGVGEHMRECLCHKE